MSNNNIAQPSKTTEALPYKRTISLQEITRIEEDIFDARCLQNVIAKLLLEITSTTLSEETSELICLSSLVLDKLSSANEIIEKL